MWLTPELAGYIQEQRVPACWVAKNMHGMSRRQGQGQTLFKVIQGQLFWDFWGPTVFGHVWYISSQVTS